MTKEQIYDILEDVAADAGTDVEGFIQLLQKQRDEFFANKAKGLPKEAAEYVNSARTEKSAARRAAREEQRKAKLDRDVKRFRELFPQVKSEGIPDTVWADMNGGIPLPYAYALYVATTEGDKTYADAVNAKNSETAPPPVNPYDGEGELTMEQVEAMSPEAVKKSFPQILRSLGKWKI